MAGNFGFFLKGIGQGIPTGFEMGWKKKQQKKLEEEQKKIIEGTALFNNMVKQYGEDGVYSDDDIAMLNTAFLAAGAEVQEYIKGTREAILSMNKAKVEQDFEWLELASSWTDGLDPKNAKEIFNYIGNNITTEKGKNLYTAYENLHKKKYEAAQNQPTAEVFASPTGVTEKYPEAGYEYSATAKGYVPTYQKPTTEEPTEIDILKDNKTKLDFYHALGKKAFTAFIQSNPDLANTGVTFENYGQGYEEPETGEGKPRVTSLPQLEDYRDKALNADTWEDAEKIINDYTEAGYDATQLGITKETWANGQKEYLNKIKMALDNITDEKGWLKTGTLTSDEVGLDFKGDKKVEDIYKELYEEYMKYFNMLTKMGLSLLEFPILKPLSEIEKVGFIEGLKTFGGVGRGQYKSIYQ